DGKIVALGPLPGATATVTLDATDKVVAPGFVDAHVHGDLALLADPYHEPAIRQGVTTYVVGQDGDAPAPASPAVLAYLSTYTTASSGGAEWRRRPADQRPTWQSIDEYLSALDRRVAVNVATLMPNGNARMEVMGLDTRPPTPDELAAMKRMVTEAMEQGA